MIKACCPHCRKHFSLLMAISDGESLDPVSGDAELAQAPIARQPSAGSASTAASADVPFVLRYSAAEAARLMGWKDPKTYRTHAADGNVPAMELYADGSKWVPGIAIRDYFYGTWTPHKRYPQPQAGPTRVAK